MNVDKSFVVPMDELYERAWDRRSEMSLGFHFGNAKVKGTLTGWLKACYGRGGTNAKRINEVIEALLPDVELILNFE